MSLSLLNMSVDTHQMKHSLYLKHKCVDHSVVDIFELIASRRWQRLKATIFMHRSALTRCHGKCHPSCTSRHNALHYACQFHPPLDVIRCLCKAYPKAVFERDCKQRYPLHIACMQGCSFEVVNFLLNKNPEAAKKADIKYRTPFLHAFKSYVCRSGLEWSVANKELIRIARALLVAAPMSPMMQDCDNMTAIEYALDGENDISTIKFVQFVSLKIKKEIMKNVIDL